MQPYMRAIPARSPMNTADDTTKRLRYDWEGIIRRARLNGVIPAQAKRGAVSGTTFRAIALVWASYANPDGTNIFPGVATVAVAAEVSFKTAKLVTARLVELGLLVRVMSSDRRRKSFDLYRLAIPETLLDDLVVLDPDQMAKAAEAMRESYRGKPSASVGGPADPIPGIDGDFDQVDDLETGVGSSGPPKPLGMGSGGPAVGGPPDRGTYQGTMPLKSTQPSTGEAFRTDVAVESAPEDQIDSHAGVIKAAKCPYYNCNGQTYQMGVATPYRRRCPIHGSR